MTGYPTSAPEGADASGGPRLFGSRSWLGRLTVAAVLPAAYGVLCGWLLGVDKVAYTIVALLGLLGAYSAGLEHEDSRAGGLRGLIGGAIFGGAVLATHHATGARATSALPSPEVLEVAITGGVGLVLGRWGGARRADGVSPERTFSLGRLGLGELTALAGAGLLVGSLFVTWFSTSCDAHRTPAGCNPNSLINGSRGAFDAFQTYHSLYVLLIIAAIIPVYASYVLVGGYEVRWRPGELIMIAGVLAFGLVLINGIVFGRPGGASASAIAISIGPGYFLGMAGGVIIAIGGFIRESAAMRTRRRPPGILAGA